MVADEGVNVTLFFDIGGERARIQHIRCEEELGRPFTIKVEVLVRLGEIDVLPHLGKPVALKVREWDDAERYLNGVLTESEFVRESRYGYHYVLTVRPFTYFLDQNSAYSIFQDKSALDIIKQVFERAGARDVDYSRLSRAYGTRAYCVQYGESDFAFVSRLMQEEGIYYFFRHEVDKHVLVLCDGVSSHVAGSPPSLAYNPNKVDSQILVLASKRQHATFHRLVERIVSAGEAKVTMRDFDLEKADRPMEAQWTEAGQHSLDVAEVFEYPGRYKEESRGGDLSKTQLIARRAERELYTVESDSLTLTCGATVKLAGHPAKRFNYEYLLVRTVHSFTVAAPESDDERRRDDETNTVFEAIKADTPYGNRRSIPRPQVRGLETAIVSGPDGETIYTDKYGRVKVRFHWDRSGSAGDQSTCWIRVAQFSNLGSAVLPRVGQEVMVDFLHGDPDRPIVCGWVFNSTHMPVYDLPANKTRALWRTKRYGDTGQYPNAKPLDTGAPGVNELRFEDKGGSEEVFLHAERDMNTRIRFAETHNVGQNQSLDIGYDRTIDVGNNETHTIGVKHTLHVKGDQEVNVDATRIVTIKADDELDAKQSLTINVGTDLKITANKSITIQCGTSKIELKPDAITITGGQVTMEGIGTAKVTSPMTTLAGTGINTISGGLVKIN